MATQPRPPARLTPVPPIAMLVIGGAVEQFGLGSTYLALAFLLAAFSIMAMLAPGVRELDRSGP